MDGVEVIGIVAVAILCFAQMVRPVTNAEKAHLLCLAQGDPDCLEIADRAVGRKWLMWTDYDAAKQAIERVKITREQRQLLADSAARTVLRNAQERTRTNGPGSKS